MVEIVDTAGRIVGTSAIAALVEGGTASLAVTAASTELVGGVATALIALLATAGALTLAGVVVATTGDEASPFQ